MNFYSERGKINSIRSTKPIAEGATGEEENRFDKATATRKPIFCRVLSFLNLSNQQLTKNKNLVILKTKKEPYLFFYPLT